MTTYKIVGKTNPWIAQRDSLFNGKTEITIESNLSLSDAKKKLLEFFCSDYETSFANWGAVMRSNLGKETASRNPDGTYTYDYDSRQFSIEKEELTEYTYLIQRNAVGVKMGKISFRTEEEAEAWVEEMEDAWKRNEDDVVYVMLR